MDLRPSLHGAFRILLDHDALARLDAEKGSAMPDPIVYCLWRDDLLLDLYADAGSAGVAVADYRAAYPGNWQQLPSGTWYVPGRSTRLWIEVRVVLTHPISIHPTDVAPRDTTEAL